ncbi:MAG: autotransporter domain-containing protein [Phaeodactylibacter sp.]|nr:autotransporter domain-containing protein [Phaeodactylibacter sp.]
MKYFATLTFAILLSTATFAQLGINATYRTNDARDWQYIGAGQPDQSLLPGSAFAIGLDYWIPMKAYRIDFVPEFNFSRMSNTIEIGNGAEIIQAALDNTWLSLFLNTNIYFLDLEGDCDCPTFSKSGGTFQKGFFFQLSPGVTWMDNQSKTSENESQSQHFAYSLGVGIGLDIGLSDILTLTPFAGFRYYLPTQWDGLDILSNPQPPVTPTRTDAVLNEESSVRQFYAGLRLGVRLDQR